MRTLSAMIAMDLRTWVFMLFMCWILVGHAVQIPQGTYGSQRVQQTQNTLYTNNYSNIEEVNNMIK